MEEAVYLQRCPHHCVAGRVSRGAGRRRGRNGQREPWERAQAAVLEPPLSVQIKPLQLTGAVPVSWGHRYRYHTRGLKTTEIPSLWLRRPEVQTKVGAEPPPSVSLSSWGWLAILGVPWLVDPCLPSLPLSSLGLLSVCVCLCASVSSSSKGLP